MALGSGEVGCFQNLLLSCSPELTSEVWVGVPGPLLPLNFPGPSHAQRCRVEYWRSRVGVRLCFSAHSTHTSSAHTFPSEDTKIHSFASSGPLGLLTNIIRGGVSAGGLGGEETPTQKLWSYPRGQCSGQKAESQAGGDHMRVCLLCSA